MKLLSRSILIMLLVDFTTILCSTLFWCNWLGFSKVISLTVLGIALFFGLSILFLKENYKIREFNTTFKNIYLLLEGILLSQLAPLVFLALSNQNHISCAKFYVFNTLSIFLILMIYRIFFHKYLKYFKSIKKVLILGTNDKARIITDEINKKQALKMNVVGYIENEGITSDLNILALPKDIIDVIKEKDIDIIIMADPDVMARIPVEIPTVINMYGFYDIYEMITGKFFLDEENIDRFCNNFLVEDTTIYDICKRIFDVISALIILIVTFPVVGFIALRVYLTDKENPFYTQTRITAGGKKFELYKLRTMYVNDFIPSDKNVGFNAENPNEDDRIIPFCKFVRKARLDEIPQMINILKGEMSIVGPRAIWNVHSEIYEKEVPHFATRYIVKSAWTGYGHISCGHTEKYEDESERLQYDLYFIKHRNILWEIGILIKAVFLVLGKRNPN